MQAFYQIYGLLYKYFSQSVAYLFILLTWPFIDQSHWWGSIYLWFLLWIVLLESSLKTVHLVLSPKGYKIVLEPFVENKLLFSIKFFCTVYKHKPGIFLWVYFYILFLFQWPMCLSFVPLPWWVYLYVKPKIRKIDYFHLIFFSKLF